MRIYSTLHFSGNHAYLLTPEDRAAGINAATVLLGDTDPSKAQDHFNRLDNGDPFFHQTLADLWMTASMAAINAATESWGLSPDQKDPDLFLEAGPPNRANHTAT